MTTKLALQKILKEILYMERKKDIHKHELGKE
jgi:hypothetical protein